MLRGAFGARAKLMPFVLAQTLEQSNGVKRQGNSGSEWFLYWLQLILAQGKHCQRQMHWLLVLAS